jgi:hypothetical protein
VLKHPVGAKYFAQQLAKEFSQVGAVLVALRWWCCVGGAVLVALCWWCCVGGAVLVALRWWRCVGGAALVALRWCVLTAPAPRAQENVLFWQAADDYYRRFEVAQRLEAKRGRYRKQP